jgi:hypothetical protein
MVTLALTPSRSQALSKTGHCGGRPGQALSNQVECANWLRPWLMCRPGSATLYESFNRDRHIHC